MSQIPSTHRALVINADHSGWEVKEQLIPTYDDLLVKGHAVGLNPTDWVRIARLPVQSELVGRSCTKHVEG
ncbi:hypothetical protein FIBSPDRAFT_955179 [Athelia psychrophila]|uniref:Uncharacterized protein n=1 Tax=Athelia psychrophila TaxID=1759441 RepID=A0A166IDS4_9AGAM|nr:hypothetical protein FIBSPDRAFT_955179 [Fibularhizoctonia sp. CBS 109695]